MTEWLFIAVACTILFLWLAYREYRRTNPLFRWGRIIASLVACASLALLGIPLRYERKIVEEKATAIVLTGGFNRDSVDRFIRAQQNRPPIYTTSDQIAADPDMGATFITGVQEITGKTIHVFGNGFSDFELATFNNTPLKYHPPGSVEGMRGINWNRQVIAGNELLVTGTYHNLKKLKVNVALSLLGRTVDSISLDPNQPGFTLKTKPVFTGRNQYQLTVLNGKDTLENNPVPIEVVSPKPLRVILLASFPDFEHKFLKRWLTARGYEVVAKTSISKNKFQTDLVNSSIATAFTLSASLLSKFDLLITDHSTLAGLNTQSQNLIQRMVFSDGLGIVVTADSMGGRGMFYSGIFPTLSYPNTAATINARINSTDIKLPSLPAAGHLHIKPVAGTRALVNDMANRTLVNSGLFGKGKIVFSTLANTYVWSLAEQQGEYNSFWTTIINGALRASQAGESWGTAPLLPVVNEPAKLCLRTDQPGIPTGVTGQQSVYLRQDPSLEYSWEGTVWPRTAGWQQIVAADGTTRWWYVYPEGAWASIRAADKISATKAYALSHSPSALARPAPSQETAEVNPKYFLILFLAACSFLWIEKKFLASK
ncbi:hypothetical protein EXU57_07600 [Segetibacter sp. 3557_3]|uniref:hypothetical protein n=1 Tax=Segetibacter sp. 3557_3 TaxID=2547429 RepID=UPI0010589AFE|nr:hypothetical protein [Segetibacter sp. 3557_3]TDH27440.1 hypothetical protein EXU57_07600 [Segetibacter sp. 3557_3]